MDQPAKYDPSPLRTASARVATRETLGPTDVALSTLEGNFVALQEAAELLGAKLRPYSRSLAVGVEKEAPALRDVASPFRERVDSLIEKAADLRRHLEAMASCLE